MSLETVRDFFARHAPDIEIIELDGSTATVALAAAGHGVEPGQIAKTLSLKAQDRNFLVVTRGDARLDNKKAKALFGGKVTMLADGSGNFTKALGLELDLVARGLGVRSQRYALIAEDGKVTHLGVEEPGGFDVSRAEAILAKL